ncbi:MAG TPA: polyprenyl synthetase family protein [Candidatus Gallibacteroides avistercoris]|uniref:Polyprenyl synthetase family protein n=1 Tax=Candidatus Gallibacteroides avistercoris TaxID=2840833 RepID=A0A9D1SCH0_9BACT|nr:polyprenyl synthetase family protein [Candidatus Gallibacteroides avistercoris]
METKLNQYLTEINETIARIHYPAAPDGLYEPVRYTLSLGGKRIRPLLTLMGCELFGKHRSEAIAPATAIEIFHNFTLLHDDVMDKAELRRGKPTVHCVWDEITAILSGDVMQIMAYKELARTPQPYLKEVLEIFSEMAAEICEGQQFDMEFEHTSNVSVDDYLMMIRLKTAILLGCALKIGARIADAPPIEADLLYRFGEEIGLAFQLKDDYLDVYGDSSTFGKKIGGDILNNKKTFMLISALNKADEQTRSELNRWIGLESFDPEEKITAVTRIYNQLGIDRLCEEEMEKHYRHALTSLQEIAVGEEKKEMLYYIAGQMMKRTV